METPFNDAQLSACLNVLQSLAEDPELCVAPNAPFAEVLKKAQLLTRRAKAVRKKAGRLRDQEFVEATGIRAKRHGKTDGRYQESDEASAKVVDRVTLSKTRRCYVCKRSYEALHAFYDSMCHECGDRNFAKRSQTADLTDRIALVTGGRVKIGFQVALKLLRAGASVLVTSRFPYDAGRRFSAEMDFKDWSGRLQIFGVDFRSLASVDLLCDDICARHSHLDILINNAAQTIRRPAAFYQHLMAGESNIASLPQSTLQLIASKHVIDGRPPDLLSTYRDPDCGKHLSAKLSQVPILPEDEKYDRKAFPPGEFDADRQQVDRRGHNSWVQDLRDVSLAEVLEVHAVNALTPFILIQKLESRLESSPYPDRYIVNVSAMEGQLNARCKTGFHPHTNMAKAGLNMITRTCASRFAERGIYMTSVDTGWITNEFPFEKTEQMRRGGFQPPLDEIDGAARVCDPIFTGVNQGEFLHGTFLKDYMETAW